MRGMHKQPNAAALPYTRYPQPDGHGYLKAVEGGATRLARSANPTRGKAIPYPPTANRYFLYWVGAWLRRDLLLRSARQSLAPTRECYSREATRSVRSANPTRGNVSASRCLPWR